MVRRLLSQRARPPVAVAGAALLPAIGLIAIGWPGTLTPDSQSQFGQVASGIVTDWHPPIMVRLWAMIGGTVSAMLIVQVALHWLGIWSLAETLRRRGSVSWAWAMLAVGCTPIALKYLLVIQKDSLLASFMLAAFGLIGLLQTSAPAALLGVLGMLCRANGVFALPPLFMGRSSRLGLPAMIAMSIAAAAALIPLSDAANHRLLGAQRTGVTRSLQLFDLAGIAHFSGNQTVLPPGTERAAACYTPLFWDKLVQPDCIASLDSVPAMLTGTWLNAIAAHPLSYAEHRFAHFNRTTFFAVPAMQQCVDAPTMHRCDFTMHGKIIDAVTKNIVLWPALWLAIGIALLSGPMPTLARALVLSGVLYGIAYLIVGVASDFRYFYWTELAVQVAIVLSIGMTGSLPHWRRAVLAGAVIGCVGYATRLMLT